MESGLAGTLALEDDWTLGDVDSRVAALLDCADEDEARDSAAIDEIDKVSANSKTLFKAR